MLGLAWTCPQSPQLELPQGGWAARKVQVVPVQVRMQLQTEVPRLSMLQRLTFYKHVLTILARIPPDVAHGSPSNLHEQALPWPRMGPHIVKNEGIFGLFKGGAC